MPFLDQTVLRDETLNIMIAGRDTVSRPRGTTGGSRPHRVIT